MRTVLDQLFDCTTSILHEQRQSRPRLPLDERLLIDPGTAGILKYFTFSHVHG